MSLARSERRALSDLLVELGPDAPTLCAGWTTKALAAHLVIHERRPDASPGVAIKALAPWTKQVQARYEKRPYDELVHLVRTGPGRLSPFSLPGIDNLLNTAEYAVHHEDARRAQPGWEPRELPGKVMDALWRAAQARGPMALGSVKTGVVLTRSRRPRQQGDQRRRTGSHPGRSTDGAAAVPVRASRPRPGRDHR